MVKYVSVLLLLMAFAAPAFAQDVPQLEIALGYGNLNLDNLAIGPTPGRHSGFATHQAINLNSLFAIENYFGYYGLGTVAGLGKTEMLTNVFGGRFAYRAKGPVIYGSAGIGGGWMRFPDIGAGSQNAMAFKYGGGVDIPLGDSIAWKVDVSRMSFHFFGDWNSGVNISTGIVLKIQY
jgi:Outer membrane protein beta-barrel domain